MTVALPFAELPASLQAALARKPRRTAKAYRPSDPEKLSQNNYVTEEAMLESQGSPNGGRNRKGAGAPLGNCNAYGDALYRLR